MPDEATEVKEEQEVQELENAGSADIDIDGIKVTPEKARELFGAEIDRQNGRMKKLVEETEARLARIEQEKEELAKKLMSEEEVKNFEISKREKELAERENRLKQRDTEIAIMNIVAEKGLSNDAKEFLFADSAEEIVEKANRLQLLIDKQVKEEIRKSLAGTGSAINPSVKQSPALTWDMYRAMDSKQKAEYFKNNPEALDKLLKEV